jgi:membrane protein YqaA with SNARE-associated domain
MHSVPSILIITLGRTVLQVVKRLGGPGLVALGLLDNSVVPVPGSMDAATVLLSAAHHEPWWYYAFMATIGALIGGYLTYRLGVKGGEETLEKRLSKKRAAQASSVFRRYGFWSVAVSAASPPPVPLVPFLIAAGAFEYPRRKFLGALALGRGVRYLLLAYLGHLYGRQILSWLGNYYRPLLYALIGISILGGTVALYYWRRYQNAKAERNGAMPHVT